MDEGVFAGCTIVLAYSENRIAQMTITARGTVIWSLPVGLDHQVVQERAAHLVQQIAAQLSPAPETPG